MADEPEKIYPPNPYPYALLHHYLRSPFVPGAEPDLSAPTESVLRARLALEEECAFLLDHRTALSDDDLGALLDTCRHLTRVVRVELAARTQARLQIEAEEGAGS